MAAPYAVFFLLLAALLAASPLHRPAAADDGPVVQQFYYYSPPPPSTPPAGGGSGYAYSSPPPPTGPPCNCEKSPAPPGTTIYNYSAPGGGQYAFLSGSGAARGGAPLRLRGLLCAAAAAAVLAWR